MVEEDGPSHDQSATGFDETDSDVVSEADDQYTHAKVCNRFCYCLQTLLTVFQVLEEMPWLHESDIEGLPYVMPPIH